MQLIGEDDTRLHDCVKDNLGRHVALPFRNHFVCDGFDDGDFRILIHQEGVVGRYLA